MSEPEKYTCPECEFVSASEPCPICFPYDYDEGQEMRDLEWGSEPAWSPDNGGDWYP